VAPDVAGGGAAVEEENGWFCWFSGDRDIDIGYTLGKDDGFGDVGECSSRHACEDDSDAEDERFKLAGGFGI
jgi:hypothetical protein